MSQRSRRERRIHQQEQALATGDLASLARLSEQSPRSAAAGLTRALASPPADPARAAELDAVALRLCREARGAGDPALALGIAAAGARRTPAFRMEEAVTAFALGRDDVVQEIAAQDDAVATALGPLLQAVRGELPPSSRRAPAPGLRALHAAARAVAHAVRGETALARTAVRRIPLAARAPVLTESILLAADLVDPERSAAALARLDRSPSIPGAAEVRHTMKAEAALPARALSHLPRDLAQDPEILRRLLSARMTGAASPGVVAEMVRQAGAGAFDAGERGAAELYLGFSLLRTDPGEAAKGFDRAVALGADLLEALRGKALAARHAALEAARQHGPEERTTIRASHDAAAAADRLARALERTPRAGPLAAVAGKLAAEHWLDAHDAGAALASAHRARPLAGGELADTLDLIEADAVAHRNLKEGEKRLDALLARSPGNVEAWKMKADMAAAQGAEDRADAILQEAARITRDPELVAGAREVLLEHEQLAPFEGFAPGAVTAGALAKELLRTTTVEVDPLPRAAALREALAPAARLAFDAAAVAIALLRGTPEMAEDRLRAGMLAWRGSATDLVKLTTVALLAEMDTSIVSATAALGHDAAALEAIARLLGAAGKGTLVSKLLPRFASSLPPEQRAFFKSLASARAPRAIPGLPAPMVTVTELDHALAPDFNLTVLLHMVVNQEEGDDSDREGGEGALLAAMLSGLGLVPDEGLSLPEPQLRRIEERLREITRRPPSPASLREIEQILGELGIQERRHER